MHRPWTTLTLAAGMMACSGTNPSPELQALFPQRSYTDRTLFLTLNGSNFIPASTLETREGSRRVAKDSFQGRIFQGDNWVALEGVTWISSTQLRASLPPGKMAALAPGIFDAEIVDPRGASSVLEMGLELLGPDNEPPSLEIRSPAAHASLAAGMDLPIQLWATDPLPGKIERIEWQVIMAGDSQLQGICDAQPETLEMTCDALVPIAAEASVGTQIVLVAKAVDHAPAPNETWVTRQWVIDPAPILDSISPGRGGRGGQTEVVIKGTRFLPGTRAFLNGVPLIPNGGVVLDPKTITGRTPPAPPLTGWVSLALEGPLGNTTLSDAFLYLEPPTILETLPNRGTLGTRVIVRGEHFSPATIISFGPDFPFSIPLEQASFENDTLIVGVVPPLSGMVSLWAFDPERGVSQLARGFTFLRP